MTLFEIAIAYSLLILFRENYFSVEGGIQVRTKKLSQEMRKRPMYLKTHQRDVHIYCKSWHTRLQRGACNSMSIQYSSTDGSYTHCWKGVGSAEVVYGRLSAVARGWLFFMTGARSERNVTSTVRTSRLRLINPVCALHCSCSHLLSSQEHNDNRAFYTEHNDHESLYFQTANNMISHGTSLSSFIKHRKTL